MPRREDENTAPVEETRAEEGQAGKGIPVPSGVNAEATRATTEEVPVIKDEREYTETKKIAYDESLLDNQNLNRLNAIAGRRVPIVKGGERAWGFLTLLNVDSREFVRLEPGAICPDGLFVPVNYLPDDFVASLAK